MSSQHNTTSVVPGQKGGKYLTFALGNEEYGLEILKVREIIGYMDVTAVPCMSDHIKGVINLRGQVISIVDLRARFRMQPTPRTEQTCFIVVDIRRDDRRLNTGIVVDRVSEVLNIDAASIEEPPELGSAVEGGFILGMAKIGQCVKILLDIDRVLTSDDVAGLAAIAQEAPKVAAAA